MQKPCPLNSLRLTVMVHGRKIGYGQQMIPILSVVIRSFFKVTVAFYAITMSAHYLEKVTVMVLGRKNSHTQ